ncbi:TPA: replication/maintenance protein RepL [Escherichia coli]|nr:replication/maintenance protein RepL [Escherichia coli]
MSKSKALNINKRFSENPFIKDLIIPVKNKQVRISRLGEDNNIMINQSTGEVLGGTSVVTYKKVDSDNFIKLFTQNIKLAFELTQAGQKALFVLFWAVQNKTNNDLVLLDQYALNDFINENKGLSMSLPTFKRGLGELVKSQILAMNKRKGFYYINPNFVFNGDRVAFTTVLEMNKSSHKDK